MLSFPSGVISHLCSAGSASALLLACCAIAGLYRCSQCKLRDCRLCRWCLRLIGADSFDDFQLLVTVHEMAFVSQEGNTMTRVRLIAGGHQAATDAVKGKLVGQVLEMTMEQGTEVLTVEITDAYSSRVFASLDLNVREEILEGPEEITERTYELQDRKKGIKHPRIKLTIRKANASNDEEVGIANSMELGAGRTETARAARRLQTPRGTLSFEAGTATLGPSEVAERCCGSLEMSSSWNTKEVVYVAVKGPPAVRKHHLGVWRSENSFQQNEKELLLINMLHVLSVQKHPNEDEAFIINYAASQTEKKTATFWKMERSRDSWVKWLALMVQKARELKGAERSLRRGTTFNTRDDAPA